jgi:hypothetical protein
MGCEWMNAKRFSLASHGRGGSESAPPCARGVPMGDCGALSIGLARSGGLRSAGVHEAPMSDGGAHFIGLARSGGLRSADVHEVPMSDGGALFIGLAWTGRIGVRPSLCLLVPVFLLRRHRLPIFTPCSQGESLRAAFHDAWLVA